MLKKSLTLLFALIALTLNSGSAQQARTLPETDAAALKKSVSRFSGKVVFVNFWATWCAPCVAEFPDLVKLYQKYHPLGLEVIAVSFDEEPAAALNFLDKHKAVFTNFRKSPKQEDEDFRIGFDRQWPGALPASWLFDQNGKRVYFHMAKFDPMALDKQIGALLAKK